MKDKYVSSDGQTVSREAMQEWQANKRAEIVENFCNRDRFREMDVFDKHGRAKGIAEMVMGFIGILSMPDEWGLPDDRPGELSVTVKDGCIERWPDQIQTAITDLCHYWDAPALLVKHLITTQVLNRGLGSIASEGQMNVIGPGGYLVRILSSMMEGK